MPTIKTKKLKNLNFETILNDAKKFTLTENDSYIQTYPEFLEYFKNIKDGGINKHHLIIASHFVYGWMPTIIQLKIENLGETLKLLNAVKSGHLLNEEELEILKKVINNSMVGLSKLLHFINPKDYAIWDSRIFRYLTEKKSDYGISNTKLYIQYLNGLKSIENHKDYNQLHNLIAQNFEYDIFPMRAIEITMFEADRKRQNRNKKSRFRVPVEFWGKG